MYITLTDTHLFCFIMTPSSLDSTARVRSPPPPRTAPFAIPVTSVAIERAKSPPLVGPGSLPLHRDNRPTSPIGERYFVAPYTKGHNPVLAAPVAVRAMSPTSLANHSRNNVTSASPPPLPPRNSTRSTFSPIGRP